MSPSLMLTRVAGLSQVGSLVLFLFSAPLSARVIDLGSVENPAERAHQMNVETGDGSVESENAVHRVYLRMMAIAMTPRSEAWLVSLSIFGLIAIQLRRTQKLLAHHPLA